MHFLSNFQKVSPSQAKKYLFLKVRLMVSYSPMFLVYVLSPKNFKNFFCQLMHILSKCSIFSWYPNILVQLCLTKSTLLILSSGFFQHTHTFSHFLVLSLCQYLSYLHTSIHTLAHYHLSFFTFLHSLFIVI